MGGGCTASLFLFLRFSLWSWATIIVAARGLSDDLEISLLSERGEGGSLADICYCFCSKRGRVFGSACDKA